MKKFLAIAALLLSATAALAQTGTSKPPADISTEINADLPTAKSGGIKALDLRQVLQDMNASSVNRNDPVGFPLAGYLSTSAFGVSGSAQTTTGTINSGQNTLSIGSAIDFVDGQGILCNHCGTASGLTAPTGLSATPRTPSATTIQYWVAACDGNGGYGPAATVTITTGPAQIGNANPVDVEWSSAAGCFLVWRKIGTGAEQYLLSVSSTGFSDLVVQTIPVPFWATSTHPTVAAADWLVTTISAGGTSPNLTLAANAGSNATGTLVQHDDTAAYVNWLTALNASCAAKGVISPAGSTINISDGSNNFLDCPNVAIDGQGSTIVAAGASNSINTQSGLQIVGNLVASATTTGYCMKGTPLVYVGSTAGFTVGGFGEVFQQSSGVTGLFWDFWSPIQQINSTSIVLSDACPISIYDHVREITVGGTWATSDTISEQFTSSAIAGSPVTVTYTVAGGDTPATIADQLCAKINSTAALQNVLPGGINGWHVGNGLGGGVCYVGWPFHDVSTVSFSESKSSTSGTVSGTTVTNYGTADQFTLPTVADVRNIKFNGQNVGGDGTTGAAYYGLIVQNTQHSTFKDIQTAYFADASGVIDSTSYNNLWDNIQDTGSGNPGYDAIGFGPVVRPTLSNIRSASAFGFGIGMGPASWASAFNLQAYGAQGRCFKLAAVAGGSFSNVMTNNCLDTSVSLTWGTQYVTMFGVSGGGQFCGASSNNSEGIWSSNDFNRNNFIFGGTFFGACTTGISATSDLGFSTPTDTGNVTYGTQFNSDGGVSGFPTEH